MRACVCVCVLNNRFLSSLRKRSGSAAYCFGFSTTARDRYVRCATTSRRARHYCNSASERLNSKQQQLRYRARFAHVDTIVVWKFDGKVSLREGEGGIQRAVARMTVEFVVLFFSHRFQVSTTVFRFRADRINPSDRFRND